MSSKGNSFVNFGGAPSSGLPYDLQLLQAQRQQKLAEILQQQSQQPIDVQTGGGAPAPISWGSVLAKALQGVSSSMHERRAEDQQKAAGDQDAAKAQALVQGLIGQQQAPQAAPAMPVAAPPAPTSAPVAPMAPQMPSPQAAPMPSGQPSMPPVGSASPSQPPVQLPPTPAGAGGQPPMAQMPQTAGTMPPGQAGANMQISPQMAALLAARGGPQTQAIQSAVLPQLLNRQNVVDDRAYQSAQAQMRPATAQEKATAGISDKTPALIDVHGNITPITDPNQMSAYQQAEVANQKSQLGLSYAQLNKPQEVGFGSSLVNPKTGKVIYENAPDPGAVQTGVDYFNKFGQFPPNARSPAMQQAIMGAIHDQQTQTGQTMNDVGNSRIAFHAQQGAAAGMAKTQAQTTVNEGTVNNSINIVRNLLPQAASQGAFTDLNSLRQNLSRRTNDPNAVLLKNGIDSITTEYARVMTGSTSGSPSSDAARREAGERILYGYNSGTLDQVMNQMQQEMAGRSRSQASVLGNLTGDKYKGAPVLGSTASPSGVTAIPQGWSVVQH